MSEVIASFDVRVPDIRKVELDRPWQWLAAGWQDLRRTPVTSLAMGAIFAMVGYALILGLWYSGMVYLVLPLASGFMIAGPILAAGFYELSRRHARGETASFGAALAFFRRNPRQLAVMGVVLLLLLLTWVRIAAMIFMLYWGLTPPSLEDLFVNTFLRLEALPFLIFGTAVGAVFAFIAFASTAVSIPMLLDDPRVDVITAIVTSWRAVVHNPTTMLFWAALIVAFSVVGLLPLFLGLIVTVPLLGHATWHAYVDLVGFREPARA